jgi:NADPH:quinone reductase-like Zn-dependent oxidoreductase
MKAGRIDAFGGPEEIVVEEVEKPRAGGGELVVRVEAAGIGFWDALIRSKDAEVEVTLPLILGSDLAGVVEEVGVGVTEFHAGDAVYGVTNPNFVGAYAEYAVADAGMVAKKPESLNFLEAASVPVIAMTAWQMLFDYAQVKAGQSVLILGGAGNVGAYAVQLARDAGIHVTATPGTKDVEYVRGLGADRVLDCTKTKFEDEVSDVDAVIDTVGGETRAKSMKLAKKGGMVVSAVSPFPESLKTEGVRTAFFLVEVTTARLEKISELFAAGKLKAEVGSVLPLADAVKAHEMLAGAPHKRGKILLKMGAAV